MLLEALQDVEYETQALKADAQDFYLPHSRKRLYVVALKRDSDLFELSDADATMGKLVALATLSFKQLHVVASYVTCYVMLHLS